MSEETYALEELPNDVTEVTLGDGRTVKLGRLKPPTAPQVPRLKALMSFMPTATPPRAVDYYTRARDSIRRVYLNNRYGCCVISGKAHALGVWSVHDGQPIVLATDEEIKDAYFGICGPRDNGCYIPRVLDVMRRGIRFGGVSRTIDGYIALDPHDATQVKVATLLFGGICLAFNVPSQWSAGFRDGAVWDVYDRMRFVGGHDVQCVGYDENYVYVSTWGGIAKVTWRAMAHPQIFDEAYAMLSPNWYNDDRLSPMGIDVEKLREYLRLLDSGIIPDWEAPTPPPAPPVPPSPDPVPPAPPEPEPLVYRGTAKVEPVTIQVPVGLLGRTESVTVPGQSATVEVVANRWRSPHERSEFGRLERLKWIRVILKTVPTVRRMIASGAAWEDVVKYVVEQLAPLVTDLLPEEFRDLVNDIVSFIKELLS